MTHDVTIEVPDGTDILKIFNEVGEEWRKFPYESLAPKEQGAVIRLIYTGAVFYKEIGYFESNNPERKGVIVVNHLTGNDAYCRELSRGKFHGRCACDNVLSEYMRQFCPGDIFVISEKTWELRLTDTGKTWKTTIRQDPSQINDFINCVLGPDVRGVTKGPFISFGDRPGIATPVIAKSGSKKTAQKKSTKRSTAEIQGLVMQAADEQLKNPSKTKSRLEADFGLSQGVLSNEKWGTIFDAAVEKGKTALKELSEDHAIQDGLRKRRKKK